MGYIGSIDSEISLRIYICISRFALFSIFERNIMGTMLLYSHNFGVSMIGEPHMLFYMLLICVFLDLPITDRGALFDTIRCRVLHYTVSDRAYVAHFLLISRDRVGG